MTRDIAAHPELHFTFLTRALHCFRDEAEDRSGEGLRKENDN